MAEQKSETVAAKAEAAKGEAPAAAKTAPAPAPKAVAAAAPKAAEKPAEAQAKAAPAPAPKPAEAAPKAPAAAAAKAAEPAAKAAPAVAKAAPAAAAKAAKPVRRAAPRAVKAVATPARPEPKTAKAAPAPVKIQSKRTDQSNQTKGTQTMQTETMKNETNQMADRVQAAFGDYNQRAKSTFERSARFAEELTELSKGNVEAMVASTKVAARGVETIGQDVAELSRKSFEEASAALRSFAEVKSPTDFFRLQGDFARVQFDTFVAESAKMSEALIKLAGDVAQPLTSRYTVAAEKVKTAVAL